MSNSDLKNKVVVITGASGGVGRATAREFAKYGCRVVLLARGKDGLNGARQEVEDLGAEALTVETDVSDPEQIERAAAKAEEHFGPIDIWVNNAMNSVFAPLREIKPEEMKRVTEVTYLGQVYGTMTALKRMQSRNKGSIVLVGSALAYRGIPLQSAYCASKHAIHGFFDSLRAELIHENSNIQLSMVQLPAMDTTQFGWVVCRLPNKPRPMGKIYKPEVAARAIVFISQHHRRNIYVGYPTYQTIIGNKLIPALLDKYLAKTGFDGQQTDEPVDPDRQNNLWSPVPGDHDTYGGFGDKAHDFSFTLWMAMHREWVFAILAALVAGIVLLIVLL